MQESNDEPVVTSPQANDTAEKSQTPPTLDSDELPQHKEDKETSPAPQVASATKSSKGRSKKARISAQDVDLVAAETSEGVSWQYALTHPHASTQANSI